MEGADDWARRRREAVQEHADRIARTRAAETVKAREMIRTFAGTALERGLATVPLLARAGDSRPTYRTGLTGWYLTRDGSLGVTTDGDYYHLSSPAGLRARLLGVHLRPADPPLQVGRGARDGESMALDVLLALRLAAGDDWAVQGL